MRVDRQVPGYGVGNQPQPRGRIAVWQARLAILVMINLAQIWILSAADEPALAHEFRQLDPQNTATAVSWIITI
jgi:hypothetical protein